MRQRWQGLGMAGGILMGRPFRHEVCRRNECAQFELTQFSGDATYGCETVEFQERWGLLE